MSGVPHLVPICHINPQAHGEWQRQHSSRATAATPWDTVVGSAPTDTLGKLIAILESDMK